MLDIDLHFHRGEFKLDFKQLLSQSVTGLFGESGAGKSTLLGLIAGFMNPNAGYINMDGTVLFDSEHSVIVTPSQRRVATVFQDGRLFPHLNVQENLKYGYKLTPEPDRRISFQTVVELLEIENLISNRVHELSGGEAQRVALGRALLMSPKLLLLDEPLSSLDDRLKQQVLPFLKRVKDEVEIPMVYVSHDRAEMDFLADEVYELSK